MTIARHLVMHAAEGRAAEVETALLILADAVRNVPGNVGVDLLRYCDDERRFLFIEKWESVEAHEAAKGTLPKELFEPMKTALVGPSEGSDLIYLKTV
jgi:quinol monooxygenase YgiN